MKYKVLVGIDNDKTGNRYEIGDMLDNDIEKFDEDVIVNWLAKGVLELIEKVDKPKRKTKAAKKSESEWQ